jgi:Pyruvate/2-oxoacid:ferredoxin oxidoreductase delta subunit
MDESSFDKFPHYTTEPGLTGRSLGNIFQHFIKHNECPALIAIAATKAPTGAAVANRRLSIASLMLYTLKADPGLEESARVRMESVLNKDRLSSRQAGRSRAMSDAAYIELQEFLNQFPLGFPKTESGIEIEILKRLFEEEEARLAVILTPFPEQVSQIAARAEQDESELEKKLESMSRKGLVFRARRQGKTFYNAAPFMIGLYEYSVKTIDKRLAELFKEYYESAYLDEMGASDIPGFKVVPVEQSVRDDSALLPFHKLEESVRAARKIAVTECVCRKEARLLGKGCDHPIEACLSFGIAAEYYIENGMGREISAPEAIKIIEETDRSGLVHASANSKHLSNICNCCPCCCASMKGITTRGHDRRKYMNALFEALVDEESCTVCEVCVERCPVGAITIEQTAIVDRGKCLGCGVCAGACPTESIALRLREDREEPFDKVFELGVAILEAKANKERKDH